MSLRHVQLVGRHAAMAGVISALSAAHDGSGATVFLLGRSGLGTTRVAAEAVREAERAGMVVARGRASATAPAVPFRPVAEALLTLVRAHPDVEAVPLGPYRALLGTLVPDWRVGSVLEASPVLVAEGVLRLCTALGLGRGCVIVLEDLDLADAETLAAAEYLADNVAGLPVSVIATGRDPRGPVAELARAGRQRGVSSLITLAPLSGDEVEQMAAGCLGTTRDRVPPLVLETLRAVADGSPLVVEELVNSMLDHGRLISQDGRWVLREPVQESLSVSLEQSINDRLDRLEQPARDVLDTSAVLGERFPLSIVQHVHDLDDHRLHALLAGASRLVLPDDSDVDGYRFRHPVFREVILRRMTAASRRSRELDAAEVLERLAPQAGDDWVPLVVDLLERSGHRGRAAGVLAEAGNRALRAGAAASAVTLLERAYVLLTGADETVRLDVLDSLLSALADTGQVDRAFALGALVDVRPSGPLIFRRAEIHLRLAWLAQVSGRVPESRRQVVHARTLLMAAQQTDDPPAARRLATAADAVDAYLAFDAQSDRDGLAEAVALARSAAEAADTRVSEPGMAVLSCQAWHLLGLALREQDLAASDACFARVRDVAERHDLPTWRLYGLGGLAGNDWLSEASLDRLRHSQAEAEAVGGAVPALTSRAILALADAMAGRVELAQSAALEVDRESRSLRLQGVVRYSLMVRAVAAAHQGDRVAMTAAVAEMSDWGGDSGQELALARGLGQVFCALLEEDGELAARELAALEQAEPRMGTTFFLTGEYGLAWLLRALGPVDRRPSPQELDLVIAGSAGSMRWNRHFLYWARAVILGTAGKSGEADVAAAQALERGAAFPVALHLATRLVAEQAGETGWGSPTEWLRAGEAFFEARELVVAAGACRMLLRRSGEPVYQRRAGADRIPETMRQRGVTVREFDVLELLRHRMTNREIAQRLFISPRTVEKHVANGLEKLGIADRSVIADDHWWNSVSGGQGAQTG